jgi:hypothetical protein
MLGLVFQGCQRFQIACISQLVKVDNLFVGVGNPVQDKVGTNEASATGHENGHFFLSKLYFISIGRPCDSG